MVDLCENYCITLSLIKTKKFIAYKKVLYIVFVVFFNQNLRFYIKKGSFYLKNASKKANYNIIIFTCKYISYKLLTF